MSGPLNLSLVNEATGSIIAYCKQGKLQTGVLRCLLSVQYQRSGGKFPFPCPGLSEKGSERRGQVGIGNTLQLECVTAC